MSEPWEEAAVVIPRSDGGCVTLQRGQLVHTGSNLFFELVRACNENTRRGRIVVLPKRLRVWLGPAGPEEVLEWMDRNAKAILN